MRICYPVFLMNLFLVQLNCPPPAQQKYPCLPSPHRPSDIVSAERVGDPPQVHKVTVEDKLAQLGARCNEGKLVDAEGKEIRFYRLHCFGAPTSFAMEALRQERAELDALKDKYTVIEMTCSPSGAPTP